jgi:glycosyl transferase, family 25
MLVLVLNLAFETGRMAFQTNQMKTLGLEMERLDAITPANLSPPPDDPYWLNWERPLRDTEKAALQSHLAAWKRIAKGNVPCLVLEDDALLSSGLPAFLQKLEELPGIEHVTLETRNRKKLLARDPLPSFPAIRRIYQDRSGAAAYVLWPLGAQKLIRLSHRSAGLADAMICAAYEMVSFQAEPALAIQLDQCQRYGLKAPLETASSIDYIQRPGSEHISLAQECRFRYHRILGQARMALRQLVYAARASRRKIEIDPNW